MNAIAAVFENGIFRPVEPISLPEGCEVLVQLRNPILSGTETLLEREIAWLTQRSSAEIEQTRLQVFSQSTSARLLPPGQTLSDVVEGQWPSDESEEEIQKALERLT